MAWSCSTISMRGARDITPPAVEGLSPIRDSVEADGGQTLRGTVPPRRLLAPRSKRCAGLYCAPVRRVYARENRLPIVHRAGGAGVSGHRQPRSEERRVGKE